MKHSLLWIVSDIVVPALHKVLPEDPIDGLKVGMCRSPYDESGSLSDAVEFEVVVAGENYRRVVYDPRTFRSTEDSRDRLISDLADFVAESRFGWGQKRD